jgi:hypothetical protein
MDEELAVERLVFDVRLKAVDVAQRVAGVKEVMAGI